VLPLNTKQVLQYKLLRFFYVAAMVACISAALYYFDLNSIRLRVSGLTAAFATLCFLFIFRAFIFPPDIRTGFAVTIGLFVNYGIVVYLIPDGWMFGFFYIFYSIVCFQGLIILIYLWLILNKKHHNLPSLTGKIQFNNKFIFLSMLIFFAGSIALFLYFFSPLGMDVIDTAPADQRFWIWLGFFLDLAQQGFIITKVITAKGYQREINEKQFRLMHDWDKLLYLVFLVGFVVIIIRGLF
jgi:hypothetical protein